MERVTISMSDEFAAELALFMASHHYDNRSEAVRDLARFLAFVKHASKMAWSAHVSRRSLMSTTTTRANWRSG